MTDHRESNAADLVALQQDQWLSGVRVTIEDLLAGNDAQSSSSDVVLDLIYNEILLRENLGETPSENEYTVRFPELKDQIARQLQVHRALQAPTLNPFILADSDAATVENFHADTAAEPSTAAPLARNVYPIIPGFQLLSVAGRGGSGVAYRAFDTSLKRVVAIKLLTVPARTESTQCKQLLREAEAAAALTHASIVKVLHVGQIDETPYLVMDFIDGGSLAAKLKSAPLPVTESVKICRQVAAAIQYAHQNGVIHRDLKPGNILLDSQQQSYVCDFGLARKPGSDESMHATGDVIGTPAYMPPEQARGERVDARADVYSLGAILYECLCGRPPFQAATSWEILHQVLTNDVLPLRQLNPALPIDLETICARCLEKSPDRRYATAQHVFDELDRFQKGMPILARPVGPVHRLLKWIRRHPGIATVLSVSAASLLAVAVVSAVSERRVAEALADTQTALQKVESQRDIALKAMNDLIHKVHDDLQKREASVEARGEVLQSAIAGLQKIMDGDGDREDTRLTMATALTRLGYILTQQGKNEDAEVQYLRSIELADQLKSVRGLEQRAQNYSNIALFYVRAANFPELETWAVKTENLVDELLKADPSNVNLLIISAQAKAHLATAAFVLKSADSALLIRQEAQQASAKLYAEHPDLADVRNELIDIDLMLIQDYLTLQKTLDAERYVKECLEILSSQAPDTTEDVQVKRRYCSALRFLGMIQFAQADYQSALSSVQTAIDSFSRLVDVEPNRPGFHLRLATMHEVMADCQLALGNLEEAKRHAEIQILEMEAGIKAGGPSYSVQRFALAKGHFRVAGIELRRNDLDASAATLKTAAKVLEPIIELYNTREVHQAVVYSAELMAGLAGQPNNAEPADLAMVTLSFQTWLSLSSGDDKLFLANEQQMNSDVQTVAHPVTRGLLCEQLAACYALRYGLLQDAVEGDSDEARRTAMDTAEAECIAAIRECQKTDPLAHVRIPELRRLQSSAGFRQAFALK